MRDVQTRPNICCFEEWLCERSHTWFLCHFVDEVLVEDVEEGNDFEKEELEQKDERHEQMTLVAVSRKQQAHAQKLSRSVKAVPALEDPEQRPDDDTD